MGSKSIQFSTLMPNLLPDWVDYTLNLYILGPGGPPGGGGHRDRGHIFGADLTPADTFPHVSVGWRRADRWGLSRPVAACAERRP